MRIMNNDEEEGRWMEWVTEKYWREAAPLAISSIKKIESRNERTIRSKEAHRRIDDYDHHDNGTRTSYIHYISYRR
jgi:hypothetical protein